MKREDLKAKLRRHYDVRHGMVDVHLLTVDQFTEEALKIVEEFMEPKPSRVLLDTPDGNIPVMMSVWRDD